MFELNRTFCRPSPPHKFSCLLRMEDDRDQQPENRARGREGDDGEGAERNVRPRLGPNRGVPHQHQALQPQRRRYEPFKARVALTAANLRLSPGNGQLPPNDEIVTLQDLMANGPEQGRFLLCLILAITATNNTQVQQRGYQGARGQVATVRHSRKITLMCLLSDPGSNTAIIFNGNGNTPRLLSNLETRDNGDIREC